MRAWGQAFLIVVIWENILTQRRKGANVKNGRMEKGVRELGREAEVYYLTKIQSAISYQDHGCN